MNIETLIAEQVRAVVREELAPLLRKLSKQDATEPAETCGVGRASEILGVGKPRIYQLTSSGDLPHKKNGVRLVFEVRKLEAWKAATGRN